MRQQKRRRQQEEKDEADDNDDDFAEPPVTRRRTRSQATKRTRAEPSSLASTRQQSQKQKTRQTKTKKTVVDANSPQDEANDDNDLGKGSVRKKARTGKGKAKATKASNTPAMNQEKITRVDDNAEGSKESDTGEELASFAHDTKHTMDETSETMQQQQHLDDGSDMDEDIDWEDVAVPENHVDDSGHAEEEEEKPNYQDVEVVFEAPRAVLKKSKWEMAYERGLREMLHNCHVVLLIAHYMVRNAWCSRRDVQAVCLSVVPEDIQSQVEDRHSSELAFSKCMKQLLSWWRDYFKLKGPGLLTRTYDEYQFLENFDWTCGNQPIQESLKARDLLDGENIPSSKAFAEKIASKNGFRDTSAELFVAILRALGFETRLIASLQPIPYRIPAKKPESDKSSAASKEESEDKGKEEDEEKKDRKKKLKFPMRTPRPRLNDDNESKIDAELKGKTAKPPTVWAEIFNPHTQKWVSLDPIRTLYDNSRAMEPGANDRRNNMSYVLAFSDDLDGCIDVTQRYTPNMSKAVKLRERELTKREKEGGMQPWWETFYPKIKRKNWTSREDREQEELQRQQAREPMPTSVAAFNNHPLYALERHLKKFEILHPREPVLGHIKGEPIYPRSCVKMVHTPETWMKFGRTIKDGEQPVKHVNARAVTAEKRRIQELAKQSGEILQVGCYGEWQTEPYKPPPVVDGIVPRNAYGNVDLFTPEMLPEGAAHIPINGIAKIAKKLGIDYAEAIVDFEFVKNRSIPVTNGIVVAAENEDMLLEAWAEHEQKEANKAIEKQEKEVFARWRKLILGVLIKARLDRDYAKKKEEDQVIPEDQQEGGSSTSKDIASIEQANASKWEAFLKNRHAKASDEHEFAGGGFVQDEPAGGGFFEDDE